MCSHLMVSFDVKLLSLVDNDIYIYGEVEMKWLYCSFITIYALSICV